jgi:hypothetical protein
MTLFLLAGSTLLLAGALHAQQQEPSAPAARELPAPPKVKTKQAARSPAPARSVQSDSTAKPTVPRKSKAAAAEVPRKPKQLPPVEKPAKPSA